MIKIVDCCTSLLQLIDIDEPILGRFNMGDETFIHYEEQESMLQSMEE